MQAQSPGPARYTIDQALCFQGVEIVADVRAAAQTDGGPDFVVAGRIAVVTNKRPQKVQDILPQVSSATGRILVHTASWQIEHMF
jgi:hypothetical protein